MFEFGLINTTWYAFHLSIKSFNQSQFDVNLYINAFLSETQLQIGIAVGQKPNYNFGAEGPKLHS